MGKNIRNVCLVGHSGHGKTTLAEAMLYLTKATSRFGKISDGNTTLDYDKEEIKRGFSISLAVAPITWKNTKINFIDTPGYLDFYGEVAEGLKVAKGTSGALNSEASEEVVDGKTIAVGAAAPAGVAQPRIKHIHLEGDNVFLTVEKDCVTEGLKRGRITDVSDLVDEFIDFLTK